jgi:hypothetical protein
MEVLKYWWEFGSMASDVVGDRAVNRQFRAEIWDTMEVAGEGTGNEGTEVTAGENPFSVEWPQVDKFTPIMSSVATFQLMSMSNFQYKDLWTEDIQRYRVLLRMLYGGATEWVTVWEGWLNAETYEEDLYRYAGDGLAYPVTFYASDFNVLRRIKFVDRAKGGEPYRGLQPIQWYLDTILKEGLGLTNGRAVWALSTRINVHDGTIPDNCFINASNWYDEDGVAMSCWEVMEEILRVFGGYMVGILQGEYTVWLPDYNSALSSPATVLPDTLLNLTDGRKGATGTAGTEGTWGYEPLKNGLTVTSSRYAYNTLEDWKAEADELDDYKDTRTSEDGKMERRRYGACRGFEIGGATAQTARFWHLRALDGTNKEEVWCCLVQRDEDSPGGLVPPQAMEVIFEDSNTQVYPNPSALLRLNMQVKIAQRVRWRNPSSGMPDFLNESDDYEVGVCGGVVVFSALELIGNNGEVKYHLTSGWYSGPEFNPYPPEYMQPQAWVVGADTTERGQVLFTTRTAEKVQNSRVNNRTLNISPAAGKVVQRGEGFTVPLPPNDGYLRWTVRWMDICDDYYHRETWPGRWRLYGEFNSGWPKPHYDRDLFAILINDVRMETEDGARYELSDEDVVHTSHINIEAESAMEDVTLKVCTSYEPGMAIGNGDLFAKTMDGILMPITASSNAFSRLLAASNLEKLLVRSYHSNFTGQFIRFGVESQYALPAMGCRCRYGQYTRGEHKGDWVFGDEKTWFLVRGQVWDCRRGRSTLECVQVSYDNKNIIEGE